MMSLVRRSFFYRSAADILQPRPELLRVLRALLALFLDPGDEHIHRGVRIDRREYRRLLETGLDESLGFQVFQDPVGLLPAVTGHRVQVLRSGGSQADQDGVDDRLGARQTHPPEVFQPRCHHAIIEVQQNADLW